MKQVRRTIELITTELQAALRRETADIIAIGNLLIEAQNQLDHGEWFPWLAENFGSSTRTAENYMAAARFGDKYEIVSDLKLRPTTLYLLGRELDYPTGLYSRQAIKAILKAAETRWINVDEAEAIAKSLQPAKPDMTLEAILAGPANEAEQAAADKAEAEAILDGTPPELPPTPEPAARDVILPPFDQAVTTLAHLQTKPLGNFVATTHEPDKIRAISVFLQEVAYAIEARGKNPMASSSTVSTGEPRPPVDVFTAGAKT